MVSICVSCVNLFCTVMFSYIYVIMPLVLLVGIRHCSQSADFRVTMLLFFKFQFHYLNLDVLLYLTELRFYVPLHTKLGHFRDVLPSRSLSMVC